MTVRAARPDDLDAVRGLLEAVGYGADPDIGRMVKTI